MNEKPNPYDGLYNSKPDPYSNLYPPPPDTTEAPDTPPQPFVMHSDEVEVPPPQTPGNAAYHYPPPQYAGNIYSDPSPQIRTAPPKPKAPFSPIPLLLIAGVAFLFLGGIIFLTNTWDMLPDSARALSLFSAGIIAFGANALAERVFKLPKTGLAFYILGCIFLPLAMAGVGAFSLLGNWFSFDGSGRDLVWTLVYACVAVPALFGQKHYKSATLAWFGLSGVGTAWIYFSMFLSGQIYVSFEMERVLSDVFLFLFAAGVSVWAFWYCRRVKDSPICRALTGFLYPMLAVYGIVMISFAEDACYDFPTGPSVTTFLLMLGMAVLFCNSRFASGKFHTGIFGAVPCLFAAFAHFTLMDVLFYDDEFTEILFCLAMTAFVLMGTLWFPKLPEALRKTFSIAGIFLCGPFLLFGSAYVLFCDDGQHSGFVAFLYLLLFVSLLFFAFEKTKRLARDTPFFCVQFAALFVGVALTYARSGLMTLFLATGALLLLVEAAIGRRLWPLVLAIGACTGVLMKDLMEPMVWFSWFCTAGLLAGVIYAHICRRPLLEKCTAWVGLSMLLAALGMTLDLYVETEVLWALMLAMVTLLYLLEAVVFWKHSRSESTGRWLGIVSLFVAAVAFVAFVSRSSFSAGIGFLMLVTLGVFTAVFVQKPKNFLSVPYLIMFFFTARHMIVALEYEHIITDDNLLLAAQAGSFLLILAVFAVMGRLLLPEGFCDKTDGRFQVDFPLLAGILPVFSVSEAIDWYPQILTSLFLSLYSLLYIGRVKSRNIPALLASFFGCMTIFFHNIHDPWDLFARLSELDIRTPQILLTLLPMHLFILTLLWILPEQCKRGVHTARFCMYCVTMLCLLTSSFTFGHVTDALILVLFSFAILAGSFFIKRLRWFTLGFAVLVVMTFRMTRMFWQSLHWSIYLFLAGAVLIGMASAYELNARKQAEHPDEPKKKFKPFSSWKW